MRWLRKHWQKLAVAELIVTILMFVAFLIMSPHLWKKFTDAEIVRNGQPASEASIYQSRSEILFIDMGKVMNGITSQMRDLIWGFVIHLDVFHCRAMFM